MSAEDLKQFYYRRKLINEHNLDEFVDCISELHFVHGVHKAAELQVRNNKYPTYHYRFTYDKGFSMTKAIAKCEMPGITIIIYRNFVIL